MANQFKSPVGDLEQYFVSEYWIIDQFVGDNVLTWGSNALGQLGVSNVIVRCTPNTTSIGGTTWRQVSCGGLHTGSIKIDGTLWMWGRNNEGQLGDNTTTFKCTPVTIFGGGTTWKQISCGYRFSSAVKVDGTLWTWGNNDSGQLGNNSSGSNVSTPSTIYGGGTNWKQISCGFRHAAAIKLDGTLWTWGNNDSGQLGNNSSGSNILTPSTVYGGGSNWKQVSCGTLHTVAIKDDGTMWAWGRNTSGELGDGTTNNRLTPVQISGNWLQVGCGYNHTVAISNTNRSLWSWGGNAYGQLGNGSFTSYSTPTIISSDIWKQVSAGRYISSAIKTDASAWMWGDNTYGQIGNNTIKTTSGQLILYATAQSPTSIYLNPKNCKQISCGNFHVALTTLGTNPSIYPS